MTDNVERLPLGLSPEDDRTASRLYLSSSLANAQISLIDSAIATEARHGPFVKRSIDAMLDGRIRRRKRTEFLRDMHQQRTVAVKKMNEYNKQAAIHYEQNRTAYHNQALNEATAEGEIIDFVGDVATKVVVKNIDSSLK